MIPCSQLDFSEIKKNSPVTKEAVDVLDIQYKSSCINPATNYELKGTEISPESLSVIIEIDKCTDKPSQTHKCKKDAEIESWLQNELQDYNFNIFSLS